MTVCPNLEFVDIQPWEMVFTDTSRIKLMQYELFWSFLQHFQLPEISCILISGMLWSAHCFGKVIAKTLFLIHFVGAFVLKLLNNCFLSTVFIPVLVVSYLLP